MTNNMQSIRSQADDRSSRPRVLLINPVNELVAITNTKSNWFNRFRVWKPLGLMVLAGRTPAEWDVEIVDENTGVPDYSQIARPDLVGISAFTSQANAAYELAAKFKAMGVPVVLGGVHATMRLQEAQERVDTVVTGEGDDVWGQVLEDARRGVLKRVYEGGHADMSRVPAARHDLLPNEYFFGSMQVSRGCPLNCNFCSVTVFNGKRLRSRPIESVIEEMRSVSEKHILIVDDNLIGTRKDQIRYAKELFRAMARAKLGKRWMGQVTINFADDEELLDLAAAAGCFGMLIGFESPYPEGLRELKKMFNTSGSRDLAASVRRIKDHGIMVAGSFALGLDIDHKGIGRQIADTAHGYGIDILNTLFLTPLPGTRLFARMEKEGRLVADNFPEDWKYYTLTHPVAKYEHLNWRDAVEEMADVNRYFYSFPRLIKRLADALWRTRRPYSLVVGLGTGLSYRFNRGLEAKAAAQMDLSRDYTHWS